nr:MAG TPA: hypothetical protein [Bacteriophage sp.]
MRKSTVLSTVAPVLSLIQSLLCAQFVTDILLG